MAQHNQFALLKQRRFLPYFLTQFLGAFNDNVYKNALVMLITFKSVSLTDAQINSMVNFSAALFILPFFLFSAMAGQLSEKYEKSLLIQKIKFAEIVIMLLGAIAFYFNHLNSMMIILFLMGAQSAFFGPIKFSIVPQHLHRDELIGGNGLIEMGTFVAILIGTILGGILIGFSEGALIVGISVIIFAILGFITSLYIPPAAAALPSLKINWNLAGETVNLFKMAFREYYIFLSILAMSWFWFYGSFYLSQMPLYAKNIIGGDNHVVTLLILSFSIGVGSGSILCERLSGHKVEIGLVPFGAIGITLFSLDLSFIDYVKPAQLQDISTFLQQWQSWHIVLDIFLIGMFGGFYIVPLNAYIQQTVDPKELSRIIAANNIFNALFMVGSALFAVVLLNFGLTIPQLFLVAAVLNALVALYIFNVVPIFFMRFLTWILIHLFYRIEKKGIEKIPENGAAVLVCNHVSYLDALIIMGCCPRPVRFVMYYRIFQIPVLNFIFRTAQTIPIAGHKEDSFVLEKAYQEVAKALQEGYLVCVFPEGGLTNNGEMRSFRRGIERIIADTPVPVIPMALQGLWGSFFSRIHGKAMTHLPRGLFSRIGFVVGDSVPAAEVSVEGLQEKVLQLRGDWK